jgi:hypothetical protein
MSKKQLEQAKAEHQRYLRRMGCTAQDLASRKPKKKKLVLSFAGTAETYFDRKELSEVLGGDQNAGTRRDIIANLYKLSATDQKTVKRRASQVGILVNKGGYGVITPGMDLKTLGKK